MENELEQVMIQIRNGYHVSESDKQRAYKRLNANLKQDAQTFGTNSEIYKTIAKHLAQMRRYIRCYQSEVN